MAAGLLSPRPFAGAAATTPDRGRAIPMIHATDLFHLHDDPDDHWDLASIYQKAMTLALKDLLLQLPA